MTANENTSNSAPKLEEFNSIEAAIQAKIKYFKQIAEELQGDQ